MSFDPDKPHRRSNRLKAYDYAQAGAYFVTLCTERRICLLGDIVDDRMVLSDAGDMVQTVWRTLPDRFPHIRLDAFIVMPNHVHGIIIINRRGESYIRPPCTRPVHTPRQFHQENSYNPQNQGDHKDRPYGTLSGSLGRIVQAFKSITTHQYVIGVNEQGWPPFPGRLWQRNYWDHVIRDEADLNRIRQYIVNNPLKWALDRNNPKFINPSSYCIRPRSL